MANRLTEKTVAFCSTSFAQRASVVDKKGRPWKQAAVLALLSRGTTIAALMATTGWQCRSERFGRTHAIIEEVAAEDCVDAQRPVLDAALLPLELLAYRHRRGCYMAARCA